MKALLISKAKVFRIFLGFLALALCFGCQKEILETAVTLKSGSVTTDPAGLEANNFMVICKSETLPYGIEAQLSVYGEIVSSVPEIGVVVIKLATPKSADKIEKLEGVQAVIADPYVRWIEPDGLIDEANQMSIGDDEPFFWRQWNMDAIDAPEAWDAGYTGSGARVFILDNGIDANHPELSPNLNKTLSKSFVPGENYYVRDGVFFHHGTFVASIVAAADNKWGVIGVAPHAEIVAVKVLSEYTGSGSFSWIFQGIIYAANNEADVINMSLGSIFNRNGNYLDENNVIQQAPAADVNYLIMAIQRAVNYAVKKGAVVVAAAGNNYMNADGNGSLFTLPADLEGVIAVSATAPECWYIYPNTSFDIPASYTNYGRSLIFLAAPGGDNDCKDGYPYDMIFGPAAGPAGNIWYFGYSAGTSMAAPHVAGVAALIIGKNGGQMDPVAVRQQLLKTADKIDGTGVTPYFGYGRVNAFRAVTE